MRLKQNILAALITVFTCCDAIPAQNTNNGGFEKVPYQVQETAPGMVLIEGGTFEMPEAEGRRKITVSHFYISRYEETNGQYLEYLKWIRNCYSENTYKAALPDTGLWFKEQLNDTLKIHLMNHYLRDEAYRNFPVVGVSAEQVKNYAIWKTDRVNEMILIREGLLDFDYYPKDSSTAFSTTAYLNGTWRGKYKNQIPTFSEKNPERPVRIEDGIFIPMFRMVTDKEWKTAALAVGDKKNKYLITPEESKYRKFDKQHYFAWLYVKKGKQHAEAIACGMRKLSAVFQTSQNNYHVFGLADNVNEWISDSTGKTLVAGAFRETPERNYAAEYHALSADSGMYAYPCPFPAFLSGKPSCATGFRLAMNYCSRLIEATLKRRKASK